MHLLAVFGVGQLGNEFVQDVYVKLLSKRQSGLEDDGFDVVIGDLSVYFSLTFGMRQDKVGSEPCTPQLSNVSLRLLTCG